MLRVFDSAGPVGGSRFIAGSSTPRGRAAARGLSQGLRLRGAGRRLAIYRRLPCGFPLDARGSAPRISVNFGAPWLACAFHPTGRFDERRYRLPPSVGGRSDWLTLLRRTLSFPIPNRFIPAHSIPNFWPPKNPKKIFVEIGPAVVLTCTPEMSARCVGCGRRQAVAAGEYRSSPL